MNYKITLLFLLVCAHSYSQVTTTYNSDVAVSKNGKFNRSYNNSIYQIITPDTNTIINNDRKHNQSEFVKAYRFAEPRKVNLRLADLAEWSQDQKLSYGIFTFQLKKAKSLSFNMDDFYLPQGTEIFIYNQNGQMITGPITEEQNSKDKLWGSDVYKGDILTIKIKTPTISRDSLRLNISNIA